MDPFIRASKNSHMAEEEIRTTSQGESEQPKGGMGHAPEKNASSDAVVIFRPDDSDEEQRPVRIGLVQIQNWRLRESFPFHVGLSPVTAPLGLFSVRTKRENWNQVKLAHLDSLIRRGRSDGQCQWQDSGEATRCMLVRFEALEQQIRLQHRDIVDDVFEANGWSDSREALEALLIDCAFVLEQLLRHWEAGTRSTTVMRPGRYRLELVRFCNQIPYMLYQELMQLVKLPASTTLPDKCGGSRDGFLVMLAIGYILAVEASEWLLTQYKGPVHHLLHLVHLHLASAVEQQVSPPFRKCEAAFYSAAKKTLRRARGVTKPRRRSLLETVWWSYGMIPPASDLHRVGIRLRRPPMKAASRCMAMAGVHFDDQDGVLELPSLDMDGLDFQLLVNLVALELEWEWESSQRLFLSYAVFMSNLMTSESDMNVLQGAGVVACKLTRMVGDGNLYWVALKQLAELNNGHELHTHFVRLAHQVKTSYDHLNSAAPCATSSCFSE